jgi:hypothetical protein
MSQNSESEPSGLDIEQILQDATIAEKISLLSGETTWYSPIREMPSVLINCLSRHRLLAHDPPTPIQRAQH